MKERVPGNIVRNKAGDFVAFQCPFSMERFTTEREQYEFTRSLMEEQGEGMDYAQRREMYHDLYIAQHIRRPR